MLKSNVLIIVVPSFLLAFAHIAAQTKSAVADQVIGTYWSPKKDAKISINKNGNEYFGKSIWVAKPRQDYKNPDAILQSRPVLGIELLSHFKFDDGSYTDGIIYDPESGNTYKCKMTIEGKYLKVRGYIGISLFGRTEFFERLTNKN